tara:strand:- start:87252 stop:87389 length:138 start_codon:yes stop_codon:yes gene_type:complete
MVSGTGYFDMGHPVPLLPSYDVQLKERCEEHTILLVLTGSAVILD